MTRSNGVPCIRCGTSEWSNRGECKKCDSARRLQWQRNNRDKTADYSRRWRENNPDKAAERGRLYRQNNPDKEAERRRRGLQNSPDKARARIHRRRTKKTEAGGSYTAAEWRALCNHYGNKCLRCGRDDVKLTADHIKPVSKGGTSNIDNMQPLCGPCNYSKQDRHIDYRPDAGPLRWLQCKIWG